MRRSRMIPLLMTLAAVGGFLATTPTAWATFPGTDGRIAFGSDRSGGTHNIFTMKPDGSDVHQLTFLTADQGAALYESWSPDGTKLVFQERNSDFSVNRIYVMNADGSAQHQLLSDPSYFDFDPNFSPAGSRVALARCRMDFEACAIYSVKSDGTALTA